MTTNFLNQMKKNILIYIAIISPIILVFSQAGNVGINTDKPVEKLHVKGTMRYEPATGSVEVGSILTSDADGNATWKTPQLKTKNYHPVYGTTSYEQLNYFGGNVTSGYAAQLSSIDYTGTSITLPVGKWIVMFTNTANIQYTTNRTLATPVWTNLPANKVIWVRSYLSDNTTNYDKNKEHDAAGVISSDILTAASKVSNAIVGPSSSMMISGEVFVENKSGADKIYYLKVSTEVMRFSGNEAIKLIDFGLSPTIVPANKLIAYKIQ